MRIDGAPPKALLFDMDGLLLDTERVARDVFIELVADLGIDAARAEAFVLTLVGSSSAHTKARLAEFLPDIDAEAFFQTSRQTYKARLEASVPLMPGVAESLPKLADQGLPMAVVTSTFGEAARHHLDLAGIRHFFQKVTGGDEVSANKPDPAPYLEGAAGLGFAAHHCAAFEDSDRGTRAAVSAGCLTAQIPDLRPADLAVPRIGQTVFDDLPAAFRAMGLM